MPIVFDSDHAAHLLRRTGFGPRPAEIGKWSKKGLDATLSWLLHEPSPGPAFQAKKKGIAALQGWWLRRMLAAKNPLVEKLALFWHDHFATGFAKVGSVEYMHHQNELLRQHALGSFRKLLKAVIGDAAMIVWLDSSDNKKGSPNENLARELMELFTLGAIDKDGAPNYAESDVADAARAFTGWSHERGAFEFVAADHDFGWKTVLGVSGYLGGEDVLDILADHPATARRLAWKLFGFFAYPVALGDPVLKPLIQAYKQHGTSIRAMLDALFRMDAFYSEEARGTRVKSPAEFLVGSLRMLKGKLKGGAAVNADLAFAMRAMGQDLFDPPSVFGWQEGLAWTSTQGMLQRARVAEQIADARKPYDPPFTWPAKKLLGPKSQWSAQAAAQVVDRVLSRLGPVAAAAGTRQVLIDYLETAPDGSKVPFVLTEETFDSKVRGLLALVLSSPEYQLA